jgi:hypothetical protein
MKLIVVFMEFYGKGRRCVYSKTGYLIDGQYWVKDGECLRPIKEEQVIGVTKYEDERSGVAVDADAQLQS